MFSQLLHVACIIDRLSLIPCEYMYSHIITQSMFFAVIHTQWAASVATFMWMSVLVHMFSKPVRDTVQTTQSLYFVTWQPTIVIPSGHVALSPVTYRSTESASKGSDRYISVGSESTSGRNKEHGYSRAVLPLLSFRLNGLRESKNKYFLKGDNFIRVHDMKCEWVKNFETNLEWFLSVNSCVISQINFYLDFSAGFSYWL